MLQKCGWDTCQGQAQCEGSMPLVMLQKDQVSTCFGKHHCLGPKDIQDSAWPKFGLQEPKCICPPGRFRADNQLPGLPGHFETHPGNIKDRYLAQERPRGCSPKLRY